jgi:hypothetical protein
MRSFGRVEIPYRPQEKFSGVDAFAEKCLALGRLSTSIMQNARQDISETKGQVEASQFALELPTESRDTALAVKKYSDRLMALVELNNKNIPDEELFKSAFGFMPINPVEISWLAGGLVFWCETEDYSKVFVNTRVTSVDRAARRAEQSVAVALGQIYISEIDQEVPVALVKYESERIEEYDAPELPERSNLDEVSSIFIAYHDRRTTKQHIIMPDLQEKKLRIVDLVIEKEEESHRSLALGIGPIFMNFGPYGVLIDHGKLSFKYGDNNIYTNPTMTLTVDRYLNEDGSIRDAFKKEMEPIVIHELQHLLKDIHMPLRLKAEKYPSPWGTTAQEAVQQTVDFMLKGPLDKSLSNEFLAQAMTEDKPVSKIRKLMIREVEDMGILYNYLDEYLDAAKNALARQAGKFDNLAEATYLVMAETAKRYRSFVNSVIDSFEEFESNNEITRDELVGLLAPHPFHTWPTVLKAVSRSKKPEQ